MRRVFDGGRNIDWSATSDDYATFRPGPPDELYERLKACGIGKQGERILDLGTGTGLVARAWARRGCRVAGIDIATEQIATARKHAAAEGLDVDFRVAPAEEPPFAEHSFETATANQCFLYFDRERTLAALRRALVPGGALVISHFSWLPKLDAVADASEKLILKYNPAWEGAGSDGEVVPVPPWLPPDIAQEHLLRFDAEIPFTRESWRGRIRASRGIGASMTPSEVEAFDRGHAALLERIAPERFTVRHGIDARVLRFSRGGRP